VEKASVLEVRIRAAGASGGSPHATSQAGLSPSAQLLRGIEMRVQNNQFWRVEETTEKKGGVR